MLFRSAKKLATSFRSIEAIEAASFDDLIAVDEIGERIAQSVQAYFQKPEHQELIARLKAAGLTFELEHTELPTSDKLSGLSIVISGTFTHHSRDEYKLLIEQNGGKNVGSVSAKTDYILAGDNMGPAKLEKAEKLGVKIINESDFLNLITPE